MMNFRERDRIDSLGIRIQGRQFSDIAFREPLTPAHERGGRILGPCAGAAIYRRTFFERVGLFDRRFFAGYEDVDIALRGIRRGFHFDYEPQAVVFHHRSPTLDKLSSRKHIEMRKNYFLLALKNYPRQYLPGLGLEMLRRMFRDLLRIPAHIRRGRFGAVLRMYMTICASLPSLFRERRDAVLGDAEFRAILDRSEREAIWRESGTPSAG